MLQCSRTGSAGIAFQALEDPVVRDAVSKLSPGDTNPRIALASTQTAATLLALGTPGLTVVMPGKEAIALAPLSVSVLDQFEKLSAEPSPQAPKPSSPLLQHLLA